MRFFDRLRASMYGRYGRDQLNTFLLVLAFISIIVGFFVKNRLPDFLFIVLIVIIYYRMLSRDYAKRADENARFLALKQGLFGSFGRKKREMQDAEHAYFSCPRCRKRLRVPKGRGRIQIHCPQCGTDFIENT